jgi:hypothetical protein
VADPDFLSYCSPILTILISSLQGTSMTINKLKVLDKYLMDLKTIRRKILGKLTFKYNSPK